MVEPLVYPGVRMRGSLSGMNPVVDRNGMMQAKAVVDNTQGTLYEGMNVRILVQQAIPGRLAVPNQIGRSDEERSPSVVCICERSFAMALREDRS